MANLTVILFLCATVPMLPALYMIPDRRSRLFLGYMLLGMVMCLIASAVNTVLLALFGGDVRYVSTNVTPFAEEVLKAPPVLFFAFFFSDDTDTLLSVSFAMGLGFAILENMVILVDSLSRVSILWAFVRGFGAAHMHSACTTIVGRGIGYVHKRPKLFICGTFSLLIYAVIAHGLFNMLIQSQYKPAAYGVVLAAYIPRLVSVCRQILQRRKESRA